MILKAISSQTTNSYSMDVILSMTRAPFRWCVALV